MYGIYLQEKRTEVASGQPVSESFLRWHRGREYDGTAGTCKYRVGTFRRIQALTEVVACRYWYEMGDGFWGQFAVTQIAHLQPGDVVPGDVPHLECMTNFVGLLGFLMSLVLEALPSIAAEVAAPLAKTDEIVLIGGGGSRIVASAELALGAP